MLLTAHYTKKIVLGAILALSLPCSTLAAEIWSEDFDDSGGVMAATEFDDIAGSPNLSAGNCDTTPYCAQGSNATAQATIATTSDATLTFKFRRSDSITGQSALTMYPSQRYGFLFGNDGSVGFTYDGSTPTNQIVSSGDITTNTWYEATIDFRMNGEDLEMRFCVESTCEGYFTSDKTEFSAIRMTWSSGSDWDFDTFSLSAIDTSTSTILTNETHITAVTATGTAATTTIDVGYYIDTLGYTAQNRPDFITIAIRDSSLNLISQTNNLIIPLSAGYSTTTRVINEGLNDGTYYGDTFFWNITTNSPTNYNGASFQFTIASGTVASSSYETYSLLVDEDGNLIEPNEPCSITNIQGCITNALWFLIVPSPERLQQFSSLWEQLGEVKPFGYVVQIIELRGALELTDDLSGQLDLPLTDEIFDPLRAGLVVIVWVAFAWYLYHRFKTIDV